MIPKKERTLLTEEFRRNLELEGIKEDSDINELFKIVAERVEELLDSQPDLLMSYLYRLDVEEGKIRKALQQDESPVVKIAELIVQRQLERVRTKLEMKQDPIDGWEW